MNKRRVPINDESLSQHIAIVGKTGSGKSYAAKGLIEQLIRDGRRVCIIDPGGDWWGLKASVDGKKPGLPVAVLGGRHADVEITPASGPQVAQFIAKENLPCVVDVSEWFKTDQIKFMIGFAESIYKENRTALHLVIDEADQFSPQNPMSETKKLLNRMEIIVRLGRKRGFRVMMITQRPAILHKNVLTQANTLIAMKMIGPQDRKAIQDWISDNASKDHEREVIQSLAKLKRGQGWVWDPEQDVLELVDFPVNKTFDAGRTPEENEQLVEPVNFADVDVAALNKMFAPPEAKARKSKAVPPPTPRVTFKGLDKLLADLDAVRCRVDEFSDLISTAAGSVDTFRKLNKQHIEEPKAVLRETTPRPAPVTSKPKAPANGKQDPLIAAAERVWPVRLTWAALCAMCGRKSRGGHFNTTRKRLIEDSVVYEENGLVNLVLPPYTEGGECPADLLEQNLPQPAAKMFAAIRDQPGMTPEQLAETLDMAPRGGHWNTGMSTLRRNGLIDDDGCLTIKAELT